MPDPAAASFLPSLRCWTRPHGSGSVETVCFVAGGSLILSGGGDGIARLWQTELPYRCVAELTGHRRNVAAAVELPLAPKGRLGYATGSFDRDIRLWPTCDVTVSPLAGAYHTAPQRLSSLATLTGHTGFVRSLTILPGSGHLVSASDDSMLRVWRVAEREAQCECVAVLEGHTAAVYAVAVVYDGACLVSSGEDKQLRLWSTDGPLYLCLGVLPTQARFVYDICPLPRGGFVSGSGEATLRVWDAHRPSKPGRPDRDRNAKGLDTLRCRAVLRGHVAYIYAVAASRGEPDLLVSGGTDRSLRVWQLGVEMLPDSLEQRSVGWCCVNVPQAHSGFVTSVCISDDGTKVVSGGMGGDMALWNLQVRVAW
jgi:WD40 repeat protein